MLGVAVCLPVSALTADAGQRKPATTRRATAAKKTTTYSATTSNARKSRLARARASVRAREAARLRSLQALQEAMTPRFKTDADGQVIPDVRAAAAIVFNPITGQVIYEENSQDKRSIASITKVMTALVYLEDNPDLNTEITIERSDVYAASTTYLKARDRVKASELLHLLLIPSDNAAARALARTSHGGMASFIERMNEKAIELGLQNTTFADPSGLNANNVSSAFDLSHLITFAASDDRICGDHAHADLHRRHEPPDDPDPQHESHRDERRRRSDGGEDRFHHQVGLLPGDAAAPSAGQPGRRRRARRDVEQRPLLGDAPPFQLAQHEGVRAVQGPGAQVATSFQLSASSFQLKRIGASRRSFSFCWEPEAGSRKPEAAS